MNGGTQSQQFVDARINVSRMSQQPPQAQAYSPTQEEWREYLKSLTTQEEFKVLDCIASKESRWRMVKNYMWDSNPKKYTAFGIFQILESTAKGVDPTLDRMEPYQNIQLAVKLYRRSGATPWLVAPQCVRL